MESNQQSSRRAARLQRVELAIAPADAKGIADGLLVPVLPSVAAAVAGSLFPRAVSALADRRDPRTRVSSPPDAGMKKPFRRRARKGSVVIHRCCDALSSVLTLRACGRIQRSPKGSLGTAVADRVREIRRAAGQFDWLHSFQHHVFDSWQRRRDSNPRGRGFGDRRSGR